MNKPVDQRVAEKIATLFNDEERGYLWLSITQGGQTKEAQEQALVASPFNQEVFNDAYKLAHTNPGELAEVYKKACDQLSPGQVQQIEKQAAADVSAHKQAQDDFQKSAFLQGVYQYEGFKYAAAQEQTQAVQNQTAQTLSEQAPALAAAAGFTR